MIIGKSQKEIEKMRASGQLVGQVLQALRAMVEPGLTTIEVDAAAEKMIRDAGAYPTFKGYNGFPFSICASVNSGNIGNERNWSPHCSATGKDLR